MYAVSTAFLTALRSPSQTVRVSVTASDGTVLSVQDGSVSMDSRRGITRTASLELSATPTLSTAQVFALVMTPGLEITIRRGLKLADGSTEYVPLGVFSTDSATINRATGGTVSWSGSDRSKKISRAKFTDPFQLAGPITAAVSTVTGSGTVVTYTTSAAHGFSVGQYVTITGVTPTAYNLTNAVIATVPTSTTFTVANTATGTYTSGGSAVASIPLAVAGNAILQSRWSLVATNFSNVTDSLTAQVVYEAGDSSDPWASARKLFSDYGYDLNFDGNGTARAVPVPDPATASAVFDFGVGATNLVVGAESSGSFDAVYNGVIATGEGTGITTPTRGEVWDTNPVSPTYYLGNYGKVPLFYSSPLLTTTAIAQTAATTLLSKLKGRAYGLSWTVVTNPALEPLDVITMNVKGTQYTAVIDSLTIPLKASDALTANARQTQ